MKIVRHIAILFFCLSSLLCYAQQESELTFEQAYKRAYTITKTTQTPVIDGRLDEDFWTRQGEWTVDF
ncbi:MAG: hypothetical protein LBN71_05640, partial [Tannerella sp.]|nr:hypothetical protein [Tannerella sp.]